MSTGVGPTTEVFYPESDGKPMADNTLQWEWMVKIVGELRTLFAGREVFVAGDLFWYPVQGDPKTVVAPDGLVAFGRPPGYRGSYKQWEEGGIAPQVVFEVLSPNNTDDEMEEKVAFYHTYGVEEYYLIDPYQNLVEGYHRRAGVLVRVRAINGFVSPRLGVRFEMKDGELTLYGPDGRPFQNRQDREHEILEELRRTAEAFEGERERAIAEGRRADSERDRAEAKRERAETEKAEKETLAAKLRELGIDPATVLRPAG